jgi:pimeloyl-ACP methyl ester carboxylesterase
MPGQEWATGFIPLTRTNGPLPDTQTASYSLRRLADLGLVPRDQTNRALIDSGLNDFSWHVIWADDEPTPDQELPERFADVEGYVIFIHGWLGTHAIWEDLPAMIARTNKRLVTLIVDHNGFGDTPFVKPMPDFDHCSPIGAMRAIERWVAILGLRRRPGESNFKTINFVGHSMGGAALYFLNETQYGVGEQTRIAIAPALLLHDEAHRAFYTTLGLGIGLVGRVRALEIIEHAVAPTVVETLADGATNYVKEEHARVYRVTPRSVTARTFAAMGVISEHPVAHSWEFMKVFLGHRDRLVGLIPSLDLMQELDFKVNQVQVLMGTHYMFSVGDDSKRWHLQNREIVAADILSQHAAAYRRYKSG